MAKYADALPLAGQRAREPQWHQIAARPAQLRGGVSEFNRLEMGREGSPPYNHIGTVVVASAWLALYAIAALHSLLAGNWN